MLVLTANLTDTDLFRNVNHFVVERNRQQVEAAAASVLLLGEEEPESPFTVELTATDTLVPPGIAHLLGVERLNPMQAGAVPKVLHSRRNLVIAAPTGSGKTLVAEVALLQEALDRDRTGVYLAPMRAIASEKRDEWQRLEAAGVRVYKTTGEDDAFDPVQARAAHIIVATPEKWDSVSRRRLPEDLVARIGAIVDRRGAPGRRRPARTGPGGAAGPDPSGVSRPRGWWRCRARSPMPRRSRAGCRPTCTSRAGGRSRSPRSSSRIRRPRTWRDDEDPAECPGCTGAR